MVRLGYDAIEWPINEIIGTDNVDEVKYAVDFAVAFCEWCRDRSDGKVRPAVLTPGGGNPDHGAETKLLVPAALAAIKYGGLLVPHTYNPVTPTDYLAEEWMKSAQVQYDYHLRPAISWLSTLKANGVDIDKVRFVFGEAGPCGAYNVNGKPGGYLDAGAGWRRSDALAGNLERMIGLCAWYEDLCQAYPQVEGWQLFTQGRIEWEYFQANEDFWPIFFDVLGL